MKKINFFAVLTLSLITGIAIEIFYLSSLFAKLFLAIVGCALILSQLKGKIPNRILNIISIMLVIIALLCMIFYIFTK